MQLLKRFGLFWVDFIVGDDWSLAVVVVLSLVCTWALSRTGFPGWVLLIVLVMTALILSVARAQRALARKRSVTPVRPDDHGSVVREDGL
jgi:hypothetical protein